MFIFKKVKDQACKKLLPENGVDGKIRGPGGIAKLGESCNSAVKALDQSFRCQLQFNQIVDCLNGKGFLCIMEILIAGKKNKNRHIHAAVHAFTGKRKAGHDRHLNIRDDNLHLIFFDHFIGGCPIGGNAHNADIKVFPVNHGPDPCLNERLVIHNQ